MFLEIGFLAVLLSLNFILSFTAILAILKLRQEKRLELRERLSVATARLEGNCGYKFFMPIGFHIELCTQTGYPFVNTGGTDPNYGSILPGKFYLQRWGNDIDGVKTHDLLVELRPGDLLLVGFSKSDTGFVKFGEWGDVRPIYYDPESGLAYYIESAMLLRKK